MVLCAFRCLFSRHQILNLRSLNQIRGKILLSWKLRHFGGSRFLQSFILPTSPITHNEGMFFFYLTRAVIMSHICLICVICCV